MDTATQRAMDALSLMVLEDGRRWGETAVQYQRENAKAIFNQSSEVKQHWVELPRGARKTTDLAGILLVILLFQAPAMARLYVGASDEDQAAELVDAARGLITRTPELTNKFTICELEITAAHNGATITALPADVSAMGLRAYLLVLDEVANWPETKKHRRFWTTLTSGNRKLPQCRTVIISNCGTPESWTWKRRETARTSEHWRFFSQPGPLPWLSATDLQILRENAEVESEFQRLHMNVWTSAEDMLATAEDLAAAVTLSGPLPPQPGTQYVCSLDIGLVDDRTVLATMHSVRDDFGGRRFVLDAIRTWKGNRAHPVNLQEVADAAAETCIRYNRAPLVADPAEGRMLCQQLRGRGIDVHEFTFTASSVGKLALPLHQVIRQRRIDLPDNELLLDELRTVRLIKNGVGIYRLDHAHGAHDDMAVALALGLSHLMGQNSAPTFHFFPPATVDPAFDPFAVGSPGQMRPRTVAGIPTLTAAGQVPGWEQYGGFPWAA